MTDKQPYKNYLTALLNMKMQIITINNTTTHTHTHQNIFRYQLMLKLGAPRTLIHCSGKLKLIYVFGKLFSPIEYT